MTELEETLRKMIETLAPAKQCVFECIHCGGFHELKINCKSCGANNWAGSAITTEKINQVLALVLCECGSMSMAMFKCHGVDPAFAEEQKRLVEQIRGHQVTGTVVSAIYGDCKMAKDGAATEPADEVDGEQTAEPK